MDVRNTAKLVATAFVAVLLAGAPAVARASSASHDQDVRETAALAALQTIAASPQCGSSCQAAYRVVAAALPDDRANVLAGAILSTANFDYARLTRVLRIPTVPEIKAQWRAWCDRTFPGSTELQRICYRLILGPPSARKPSS